MALFDCSIDATSGAARALTYTTAHGDFHTPMFMPVGTSATVKGITPSVLHDLESQVVLSNTYHLSMRPGEDIVQEAGGIHSFMGYDGPMLTDSGGFQVFSLADTVKLSDDGVAFKSIYDGSDIFWTPEKNMEIQEKIGASISVRLIQPRRISWRRLWTIRALGPHVVLLRTRSLIRRFSVSCKAECISICASNRSVVFLR